jgi:hypothetical protein
VITALRAVRGSASARIDDQQELAQVTFTLIDITVAVLLREGQETSRTGDETRADAIKWLEAQAPRAEGELLESGAVFNPDASVLRSGEPAEEVPR